MRERRPGSGGVNWIGIAVEQIVQRIRRGKLPAAARSCPPLETMERRLLLSAYTPSVLANFRLAPNGSTPVGPLVADANGNLFGTTDAGGSANEGTVFEIAKGSTAVTTLASFSQVTGYAPQSGVSVDAAGDLYGTTALGGANNYGTVYQIAAGSNVITTIASFTSSITPGLAGVTLDGSGNLFGVMGGGTFGDGMIFEIASGSSTFTTLASFNGRDGTGPDFTLSVDSSGDLFGTTVKGGTYGMGTVFELPDGSSTITALASFSGSEVNSPLTLDASGDLFGATGSDAAAGNDGEIFEIPSGAAAITTVAYFNGTNGSNPSGAPLLDSASDLFGTTSAPSHLRIRMRF